MYHYSFLHSKRSKKLKVSLYIDSSATFLFFSLWLTSVKKKINSSIYIHMVVVSTSNICIWTNLFLLSIDYQDKCINNGTEITDSCSFAIGLPQYQQTWSSIIHVNTYLQTISQYTGFSNYGLHSCSINDKSILEWYYLYSNQQKSYYNHTLRAIQTAFTHVLNDI